jgi:hypothetical protein
MARRRNRAVAWSRRVKRGTAHLDVAVGCTFVLGIVMGALVVVEKLEMLLTPWIRCARALDRGRTIEGIKINPMITTRARKTQFRLFILYRHR